MIRPKAGAQQLIEALERPNHVWISSQAGGPLKERILHNLCSLGTGVQYRVHSPDIQTALRGLLERVFYHWEVRRVPVLVGPKHFVLRDEKVMVRPHRPSRTTVRNLLGEARRQLLRRTYSIAPLSREEFLAPLSGSKLARYSDAADSVEVSPIEPRDAYLQTFVKAEKLNISAKPDPDPRVIQPRNPRFNYAVGVYVKGAEHCLYQAINRMFGSLTVMKGLNADARGRAFKRSWDKYINPVAVGLDASRFDQHVSRTLLEFEHSIYNSMFREAELAKLLRMQLRNRGFVRASDGTIKYKVEGSRMSGDMNTSLGNVLLMCLFVWSYMNGKGIRYSLLNDGDDCVLMLERDHFHHLDDLPDWFKEIGMVMKVEDPVYELEAVEFCQSHPVEITPGNWRMIRDPRVTLSKDCYCVKPVRDVNTWNMMRYSISECGLALAGDVPVFNEFYSALGRGADLSKRSLRKLMNRGPETGMQFLAIGMHRKYQTPTTTCRVSFAKAFGIWPDEQVAMEEQYRIIQPVWCEPDNVLHTVDEFNLFSVGA